MTADLKADLDKVGGASDVQLAGASQHRLEFESAVERTDSPSPAPKAPNKTKAPSAVHGTAAPAPSVHHETPAPAQAKVDAPETAPAEQPRTEPAPEPIQSRPRPTAPVPSTQREPRGGWKTPGQIIRQAPFPINP